MITRFNRSNATSNSMSYYGKQLIRNDTLIVTAFSSPNILSNVNSKNDSIRVYYKK
jgi:hypothetical protein